MNGAGKNIEELAESYGLRVIYAFGSRADEALSFVQGNIDVLIDTPSDLDIGVLPSEPLTVKEKVEIALFLEDLFSVPRVDLVVLPEAPPYLALKIIEGERLYIRDDHEASEYELYVMRRAGDLLPVEDKIQRVVLEERP